MIPQTLITNTIGHHQKLALLPAQMVVTYPIQQQTRCVPTVIALVKLVQGGLQVIFATAAIQPEQHLTIIQLIEHARHHVQQKPSFQIQQINYALNVIVSVYLVQEPQEQTVSLATPLQQVTNTTGLGQKHAHHLAQREVI